MSEDTDVVAQAFKNSDPSYLEASIKQRNPGPQAAGSVFTRAVTLEDLVNASWTPHDHPNINPPAIGFKASLPGVLGIAEVSSLPDEQTVRFQPAHGGKVVVKDEESPKYGQQLAEVVTNIPEQNRQVEHTTLLLGPSKEDPEKLIVWTFHPGDPTPKFPDVTMDDVREVLGQKGETVSGTVADAKRLKYNFVKHVEHLS